MIASTVTERFDHLGKEQIHEMAQAIGEESRRMRRMIEDLRQFSRKADAQELQGVSVTEVVDDALALWQLDLRFQRITLTREYAAAPEATLNRDQIKQVLLNLLRNAAEAVDPAHGQVTVRVAEVGEAFEIHVTDNGCGIAPEQLERIWEPFYTTKGPRGTGLGLDICRKIVEVHGGQITVQSAVNVGTTFTVRLPRQQKGKGKEPC
jgi:signal transduction histidine kinase